MIRSYNRKGEWLEQRLSSSLDGYTLEKVAPLLPVPQNLWNKLVRERGVELHGNLVRIKLFPRQSLQFIPEWLALEVLYEDDFCLVAAKPPGMRVHPTAPGETGTLANAVAAYYEATGQEVAVRHIHRLDKDTTGPVLYAKNELALLRLDEAMRQKQIGRTYIAVASGRIAKSKGTINQPIGRDRHHKSRRRVTPGGDRAVTHYEVVEQWKDACLVRLRLETGRTHQIRVHLRFLGHPLLGDEMYGGPTGRFSRQALHGERLEFCHPWTGEKLRIDAPWPDDFARLVDDFRRYGKM
jgi:23S rRNA pseudouridine1911/1915/1917 synthase